MKRVEDASGKLDYGIYEPIRLFWRTCINIAGKYFSTDSIRNHFDFWRVHDDIFRDDEDRGHSGRNNWLCGRGNGALLHRVASGRGAVGKVGGSLGALAALDEEGHSSGGCVVRSVWTVDSFVLPADSARSKPDFHSGGHVEYERFVIHFSDDNRKSHLEHRARFDRGGGRRELAFHR